MPSKISSPQQLVSISVKPLVSVDIPEQVRDELFDSAIKTSRGVLLSIFLQLRASWAHGVFLSPVCRPVARENNAPQVLRRCSCGQLARTRPIPACLPEHLAFPLYAGTIVCVRIFFSSVCALYVRRTLLRNDCPSFAYRAHDKTVPVTMMTHHLKNDNERNLLEDHHHLNENSLRGSPRLPEASCVANMSHIRLSLTVTNAELLLVELGGSVGTGEGSQAENSHH